MLRQSIIVPGGGANNEYMGGPGGPGAGFCGSGGGFNCTRSAGKPALLLRLNEPPLGPQKRGNRTTRTPPCTRY